MNSPTLGVQRDGDLLWITPPSTQFGCRGATSEILLKELDGAGSCKVIVDLSELPYFGSTILELLVTLWRRVGRQNGKLILLKPSKIGREVLEVAHLNRLWPISDSREEAIRLARATSDEA